MVDEIEKNIFLVCLMVVDVRLNILYRMHQLSPNGMTFVPKIADSGNTENTSSSVFIVSLNNNFFEVNFVRNNNLKLYLNVIESLNRRENLFYVWPDVIICDLRQAKHMTLGLVQRHLYAVISMVRKFSSVNDVGNYCPNLTYRAVRVTFTTLHISIKKISAQKIVSSRMIFHDKFFDDR